MPGCSNLRIRCPKGRGGSTPPSRTPLTYESLFQTTLLGCREGPSCSRMLTELSRVALEGDRAGAATVSGAVSSRALLTR